jgi:hypothetical protein
MEFAEPNRELLASPTKQLNGSGSIKTEPLVTSDLPSEGTSIQNGEIKNGHHEKKHKDKHKEKHKDKKHKHHKHDKVNSFTVALTYTMSFL